jgi:hypothetical protein
MGEAVLVFPAGTPEGLAFRDRARAMGLRVVGASSLDNDPAESGYEAWEHLPSVADPGFDAAFAEVVMRHEVSAVHAPHAIVWKHLAERLNDLAPGTTLTHGAAPLDNTQSYRELRARVDGSPAPRFWPAGPPKPALSGLERAGLVRLVETIHGVCDEAKMLAAMEIMRHAPAGDVVEIGSWWGRSAGLLVWLARRYRIGKVLCVDPWRVADALPGGAGEDAAEVLRIFETNLAPLALGDLNYLRATSAQAAQAYAPGLEVTTEAFGAVTYEGRIAVLHIDGDHAEAQVRCDVESWTPHVVPGGWIIFDDYDWAFGDGPRVVADDFVAQNEGRIAAHFKAGVSLFVQLKR